MEVFVDDETKLTLHGLRQHYCKLNDNEKNRKLFELLDALEFNQVGVCSLSQYLILHTIRFKTSEFILKIFEITWKNHLEFFLM